MKPFHPTMKYLDWLMWATSWLNTGEAECTEMPSLVEVGRQFMEIPATMTGLYPANNGKYC
jgi:hypothetical protein